eukprot:COSAG01_NODE_21373_length_904_cov_134.879503_2_plen_33_part_01
MRFAGGGAARDAFSTLRCLPLTFTFFFVDMRCP